MSKTKKYLSTDPAYRKAKRNARPESVKAEDHRRKREAYARLSPEKKAKHQADSRVRAQKMRDSRSKSETKIAQAHIRDWYYKTKYGITAKQADKLRNSQNNLCAICSASGEQCGRHGSLHIDHCHKTGKLRGALCYRCNQAIGYAKDNPSLLRKMADYLEKHQ